MQQKAKEWKRLVSLESQGGYYNLGLREVNMDFKYMKERKFKGRTNACSEGERKTLQSAQ